MCISIIPQYIHSTKPVLGEIIYSSWAYIYYIYAFWQTLYHHGHHSFIHFYIPVIKLRLLFNR